MPPRSRAQDESKQSEKAEDSRPRSAEGEAAGAHVASQPGAMIGQLRLPVPSALTTGDARKRLLWLGGLGAMATVGLLEWPVAVAVGAGSVIAEQLARSGRSGQSDQRSGESAQESTQD